MLEDMVDFFAIQTLCIAIVLLCQEFLSVHYYHSVSALPYSLSADIIANGVGRNFAFDRHAIDRRHRT